MITDTVHIEIQKTANSRIAQTKEKDLKFGRLFSDHMFIADYADGKWNDLRIVPYDAIPLSPATSAIHYGQSIFEGMKAYKGDNNEIVLFRHRANMSRFNISAKRMCMPSLPEEIFEEGLKQLVQLDKEWIPTKDGHSLYVRPFMFATDDYIGVKPSDTYKFMIITCPVSSFYGSDVRVKIETKYSRATEGGTGYAKAAGNYGAAMYPARLGQDAGYHQLVWTDAREHKYIEESGTMNIMFVIGDTLVTPQLTDTILPGVTRNSVLAIARDWNWKVEERKVSVDELIEAIDNGSLKEAFGVGTAATIAHIKIIGHDGTDYELPEVAGREFSNKVEKHLHDLQRGRVPDIHGWIEKI